MTIDTVVTEGAAEAVTERPGREPAPADAAEKAGAEARRRARRLAAEEFRAPRTGLAIATSLAVTVASGVAAVEILSRMIMIPAGLVPVERLSAALRQVTWNDPVTLAVAGGLAALGLLLVAASLPGRARAVAMASVDPALVSGVDRAELRRVLTRAALDVPGIVHARVRLNGPLRRRVTVRATSRYRNPGNLAELVRIAVECRLGHLDLMRPAPVRVKLSWRRD